MSQRHKWADVIIAFAEGKEIQYREVGSNGRWKTQTGMPYIGYGSLEWRVKPEKKTGWVNIYPDSDELYMHTSKDAADRHAMPRSGGKDSRIACIQIEYEEGQGL